MLNDYSCYNDSIVNDIKNEYNVSDFIVGVSREFLALPNKAMLILIM